jgi:hypothetical protein
LNVQDPPVDDFKKLKNVFDDLYENRLPVNQVNAARFENNTVHSSLLVVWKNEDRGLFHFDMTCLTKTLILKHLRQEDTTEAELHGMKNSCDVILPLPCTLFETFVREIDFECLKATVANIKMEYSASLGESHPEMKGCPRIIDTYALVHAATVMWFDQQNWGMQEMVNAAVQDFFLDTCIPWLIDRIGKEQARQDVGSSADHSR